MERSGNITFAMKKMIADYMESGCLDNIIDMYKHDESLYDYVADLLRDERMRVRIGIIALIEALQKEEPEKVKKALSSVLPLLRDGNAVVRGDAAYLLGIIGDKDAIPFLEEVAKDEDDNVKLIVKEAIDDIRRTFSPVNASR